MPGSFFTPSDKDRINHAIKDAELQTSGEIRVHIEDRCKKEVLDRAAEIFAFLKMQKTQLRNGVLFYLATRDQVFAILGDKGIHAVVPGNFWDNIKDVMHSCFKEHKFTEGLCEGIKMAGGQLQAHFPSETHDINELEDTISFGKTTADE